MSRGKKRKIESLACRFWQAIEGLGQNIDRGVDEKNGDEPGGYAVGSR